MIGVITAVVLATALPLLAHHYVSKHVAPGVAFAFQTLVGLLEQVVVHEQTAFGPDQVADIQRRLDDTEYRVSQLPDRWDEFAKQAKRAEERARSAVRRAREELAARDLEDEGLEALAGELHIVDGGDSEDEPVLALPESVVDGAQDTWQARTWRAKYGG